MTMNSTKTPAKVGIMCLYFMGLVLLLGLGSWQLVRGLEKSKIENSIELNGSQVFEIPPLNQEWEKLNYQQVEITGNWLSGTNYLLDNRVFKGSVGYEVFSLFLPIRSQNPILVNRGWVSKSKLAAVLNIELEKEQTVISGQIYFPSSGFTLGPSYTDSTQSPMVIQYLDFEAIGNLLEREVERFVVVTDPGSTILKKIWKPYVINAIKHFGYAFQWWGLAIVFIVFGVIWKRQSRKLEMS